MGVPHVTAHYTLGDQLSTGPGGLIGSTVDAAPDNHAVSAGWGVDPNATIVYALPGKGYAPIVAQPGNYYSPDGAIITDTTGDMWFFINVSAPINITWDAYEFGLDMGDEPQSHWLYIAIPPEFGVPEDWHDQNWAADPLIENGGFGNASNVRTSITNDYKYIEVGKFKIAHLQCPGWSFVRISAPAINITDPAGIPPDTGWDNDNSGGALVIGTIDYSSGFLYPAWQDPFLDRQVANASFPTMVIGDPNQQWNASGCYWVKIKGLKAPSIAGKYFFKIFWTDSYINGWYEYFVSIRPQNYPTVVVKAEVDPAYIAGRVIYCAHTAYYYGMYYGDGVAVAGYVVVEGTTPEGRHVVGKGYFSATAQGYFEVEGLAAGTYTITAHAAGMVPYTLPYGVTVMAGQSKHLTLCVQPAFKVATRICSKCPSGPIDWPRYVTHESFPENLMVPRIGELTLAPVNIATGNDVYDPVTGKIAGWPGHPWGYYQQEINNEEGEYVSGTEGWWDITAQSFFDTFFGDPNCYYGVTTMKDGRVPQWYASRTSGITPGNYEIRTYVFGYVQTQTLSIVVPETEHPGGLISVEGDIMKGGTVRAQVHFHDFDLPSPSSTPGLNVGDRFLQMEVFDSNGVMRAFNHTMGSPKLGPDGIIGTADDNPNNWNFTLIGIPNWHWQLDTPYGTPEDTYNFKIWLDGYVQTEFPAHTITLCSNSSFSFHLIRGGHLNVTIYSRDCQDPSQPRNFTRRFIDADLNVLVGDSEGIPIVGWIWPISQGWALNNPPGEEDWINVPLFGGGVLPYDYWRWPLLHCMGIDTGTYTILVYTVGYVQYITPKVHVTRGINSIADIPVYVQEGGAIKLCVDFKVEMLPVGLLQDHNSYYFRVRAFNMDGDLAATNITAVPALSPGVDGVWWTADDLATTDWCFWLFGFSRFTTPMYTGTPADGGWIDTLPSSMWGTYIFADQPYGITPGTYTITIEEELTGGRYVQLETTEVIVTCAGAVERTFEVDQAPLIAGSVYTRNFMNDFRNGSWLAASMSGSPDVGTYSYDGVYWSYYPLPGSQLISVSIPGDIGYVGQSADVATTWGGVHTGNNFFLEESGIPIPEFPAGILALISALAASLFMIRWRRETIVSVK